MTHSFDDQTRDFGKSSFKFESLEMDFCLSQPPQPRASPKID